MDKIDLIYLDYNCFQRQFDDRSQVRIALEARICRDIFEKAEQGIVNLVWSFMHQDEALLCPYIDRKYATLYLAQLCKVKISPDLKVYDFAKQICTEGRFSQKDAIHLACAIISNANFFVTCDDNLLKNAHKIESRTISLNPVDYFRTKGD